MPVVIQQAPRRAVPRALVVSGALGQDSAGPVSNGTPPGFTTPPDPWMSLNVSYQPQSVEETPDV